MFLQIPTQSHPLLYLTPFHANPQLPSRDGRKPIVPFHICTCDPRQLQLISAEEMSKTEMELCVRETERRTDCVSGMPSLSRFPYLVKAMLFMDRTC